MNTGGRRAHEFGRLKFREINESFDQRIFPSPVADFYRPMLHT